MPVVTDTPDEFAVHLRDDYENTPGPITAAGIKSG